MRGLPLLLLCAGACLLLSQRLLQPALLPRKIRHLPSLPSPRPHPAARPALTPRQLSSSPSSNLIAYPNPLTQLACTPNSSQPRPTRPLDLIVPLESSEWPRNCAGREDLCEVVSRAALEREVILALCNSAVVAQLSKWVDANRRAGIRNMMIVALDERLTTWLDKQQASEKGGVGSGRGGVNAQRGIMGGGKTLWQLVSRVTASSFAPIRTPPSFPS